MEAEYHLGERSNPSNSESIYKSSIEFIEKEDGDSKQINSISSNVYETMVKIEDHQETSFIHQKSKVKLNGDDIDIEHSEANENCTVNMEQGINFQRLTDIKMTSMIDLERIEVEKEPKCCNKKNRDDILNIELFSPQLNRLEAEPSSTSKIILNLPVTDAPSLGNSSQTI